MAWPGDRVQQMVIARLSLNNPYNNMTLLEGFFRKMTEIERERDRKKEIQKERKKEGKTERKKERQKEERKKERKKKQIKKERKKKKKEKKTKRQREKESKRVGCQMTWYRNCRKQGTTGWISLIGFARWVNVHNSICLVMVPGYRFWGGPIALQCFVHISKTPAILKWSSTILTVTHMINFPLPCWTTNGCVTMLTEDSKNHTPHPGHLNLWILPLNRARQINIHCPRNGC